MLGNNSGLGLNPRGLQKIHKMNKCHYLLELVVAVQLFSDVGQDFCVDPGSNPEGFVLGWNPGW